MGVLTDAREVLLTADPREKAKRGRRMRSDWLGHHDIGPAPKALPEQPARPAKPNLVAPSEVPRRRLGSPEGRGALLHAVAHIELNAIDLAADMIARFALHPKIRPEDREDFISDWASVCDDESRHFMMLADRLDSVGLSYGDHPAHNGLWEAAQSTRDNFPARIAICWRSRQCRYSKRHIRRRNWPRGHWSALVQIPSGTAARISRILLP